MKHYQNIFIYALFFVYIPALCIKPYKAVIIVPIADAVGSPIKTFFPEKSTVQAYAQLPVCGGMPLASSCCPRLHQFLFNEIVTVIKEEGQEVLIETSHCFYVTHAQTKPQYAYWILKKNIVPVAVLEQKGVAVDHFPPSISFKKPESINNQDVATLTLPWYDEITQQTYSAGTRFLKTQTQSEEEGTTVYLFNALDKKFVTTTITASYLTPTIASSPQEKIDHFVQILKNLAHLNQGYIPYVWGGYSFTTTTNKPFSQKDTALGDKPSTYYEIEDFSLSPKPGLDCALLILFAAQQARIPFFFKNSYTISLHLKELRSDQTVRAGDIIWIPGHVMVVADTQKNTLIEARGYKYKGQGKIQEIPLNKVFKKINSFADLVATWHAHQPLERLGEDGSVIETVKNFKLLSMRSITE